ncbi:hypothetical protein [Pseudomonas sp. H3(2019)]|uniref:hypothetical protein n=1 Tax=Pseudomonas sp. H3(2019) TaxID=2598724 RepID=UPI001197AE87|nr:hypothetical protein [Pseudomonas sp. H3(2019)]TVT81177.1 hypothetical protein FPT12_20995 [Pseudomonas sp. H3(2019)]
MSVSKIQALEGRLLNVLGDISPLEWRKYQQRFPDVWSVDHFEPEDRSTFPPWVAFRFEQENSETIARLKRAIDDYKGKVIWCLVEHKREYNAGSNWLIGPRRLLEVEGIASNYGLTAKQYISEHEPDFGPVAYDDFLGLTENIKCAFFGGE